MSISDIGGFAIRRSGSCLAKEVDCGQTVAPFRACCPNGFYCPRAYNVDCCPSPSNCTQTLVEQPQCANSSWSLFNNNGYFCCPPGQIGYDQTKSDSSGCAVRGKAPAGAEVLVPISMISLSSKSSETTATSSTSTPTLSTKLPAAVSSDTENPLGASQAPASTPSAVPAESHAGAIAGGVIGGVVVLIMGVVAFWFLLKRNSAERSRRKVGEVGGVPSGTSISGVGKTIFHEKDAGKPALPREGGSASMRELPSSEHEQLAELPPNERDTIGGGGGFAPSPRQMEPVELP